MVLFLWFLHLYCRRGGISAVAPGHPDVINESNNSHENYCTTYILYYIYIIKSFLLPKHDRE